MSSKDNWPKEKNWKHVYTRSEKQNRARQLGFEYPVSKDIENITAEVGGTFQKLNVLFVCSRNQWRSPTAERIWKDHAKISTRSAGTSPNARRTISVKDIQWADVILVMESKHKQRIIAEFSRLVKHKRIHVLDIPDQYKFMAPDLIEELKQIVSPILDL